MEGAAGGGGDPEAGLVALVGEAGGEAAEDPAGRDADCGRAPGDATVAEEGERCSQGRTSSTAAATPRIPRIPSAAGNKAGARMGDGRRTPWSRGTRVAGRGFCRGGLLRRAASSGSTLMPRLSATRRAWAITNTPSGRRLRSPCSSASSWAIPRRSLPASSVWLKPCRSLASRILRPRSRSASFAASGPFTDRAGWWRSADFLEAEAGSSWRGSTLPTGSVAEKRWSIPESGPRSGPELGGSDC